MALPIAIQSVITSSLSLVDNLMVGTLGELELASVGVATQIFFVQWMMLFGFTSGCATFMAQFWGKRDLANIRKTIGFAISVCLSISLLFFVAGIFFPDYIIRCFTDIPEEIALGRGYIRLAAITFLTVSITVPFTTGLRATQQTGIPLYISIAVFSTNTFLNYVFIFGNFGAPKLGILGAALATVIARLLELTLVLTVVFGMKNVIAAPIRDFFAFKKDLTLKVVKNALPTTANETFWGLGTALCTAAYARVGITEYAAIQAGNTINNLFIMAGFSIGDATLILVGQKLGQGKTDYAYALAKRLLKVAVGIGTVGAILLVICAKPLLSLYDLTRHGETYAFYIMIVFAILMPLTLFVATNITGVLRCGGDTRFAMIAELSCVWFIAVPMAFFTTQVMELPIYICVLFVGSAEVVKGAILLKRFISKKWAKSVIDNIVCSE